MAQTQTQTVLTLNGRTITLVGTVHISEKSVSEVSETIKTIRPDCVAIELDRNRCNSITNPDKYRELDIIKVLRQKQGFLLLANLVLASFQKRMGQSTGVKPGDEMVAAMNTAKELGIPAVMADRPIQITLRRAWACNSGAGKIKLISALLASAFSKEEISSEQIENLKKQSEMDSMMSELSEYMPEIKKVLIDERDEYLAGSIWHSDGNSIVAVLGAGHLAGVKKHLEKIAAGEETPDLEKISSVPPKKAGAKIMGWVIPAIIVAMIGAGFYFGGKAKGTEMALSWILWNGTLSAIGAAAAAGHPLAILVSFIGAPITSLCPLIGVGLVSGIMQAVFCKPKVKDLELLSDDACSVKGFYKNRILRVLLVFFLSSIGSSAGTFIAGADIITKIASLFGK